MYENLIYKGQCQAAPRGMALENLQGGVFSQKSDVECWLHAPVHQNSPTSPQCVDQF